jgi:hypothetical protein
VGTMSAGVARECTRGGGEVAWGRDTTVVRVAMVQQPEGMVRRRLGFAWRRGVRRKARARVVAK